MTRYRGPPQGKGSNTSNKNEGTKSGGDKQNKRKNSDGEEDELTSSNGSEHGKNMLSPPQNRSNLRKPGHRHVNRQKSVSFNK